MFEILTGLTNFAKIIILIILVVMATSFIATIIIRKKYRKIGKELDNDLNIENGEFGFDVINASLEDYKRVAKLNPNEVNTQAIIEKNFHKYHRGLSLGERFIKNSTSIMIVLGLLGTFYGLTLSIKELVEFLSASASTEVINSIDKLVKELISSVQGMSVAFITSLFGISSSIVITIVNILFNVQDDRDAVMVKMEEYLDNNIALKYAKEIENSRSDRNSQGDIADKLVEQMEKRLQHVFDNLGNQLISATTYNQNSAEMLQQSIDKFDKSLQTFSDNTRDFTEFNHNLRTNIERMDVSFADLVQDLRGSTKDFSNSNQTIKDLTKAIDKLENKL